MFDKYCIPKESLLNKTGDVDDNNQYISPFKDKSKRLGNIFSLFISVYSTIFSKEMIKTRIMFRVSTSYNLQYRYLFYTGCVHTS